MKIKLIKKKKGREKNPRRLSFKGQLRMLLAKHHGQVDNQRD